MAKNNRKHGRCKKSPSHKMYNAVGRYEINKKRKIAKHVRQMKEQQARRRRQKEQANRQ